MIEQFSMEKHYAIMSSWYSVRKMKPLPKAWLPPIGFVSNDTAMGFLVQTNTEVCILDYLATDPIIKPLERGRAVIEVVAALLAAGRELGFKRVNILTGLSGVKALAKRFGLRVSQRVIFMEGAI